MAIKACLTTSSCTNSGITDGILHAAREGADVANMSIGGLPSLNDGNNARSELIDRTIDEYDMQLVVSAGNDGAGANSVGDPSVATSTISVGASISQATWRSNYGSDSDRAMALIPFSSRGPREDGGFKPDVVAPGSAIATIPAWQNGAPVFGTYALPPGYGMFNGTSMSSPQVAGAAALLIGAYKATHGGDRPDPAALRDAIRASADPIAGVGAYEQGMGLVDVAGAWARLQAGYAPHAITATVPVTTPLAPFLTVPGRGVGIHERDGLVAGGSTVTRTYTLTRTSGPAGSVVR
jgi:subtilisin family serine protease